MEKKIAYVLKGYAELSEAQRAEFVRELNKFNSASFSEKQETSKSLRMTLGPIASSCPCCGR